MTPEQAAHDTQAAVVRVPARFMTDSATYARGAELGFEGVVLTDALEMQGAGIPGGIAASAVRALAAGADALCLGADVRPAQVEAALDAIVAGTRSGQLAEERLDEAAGRVAALGSFSAAALCRSDAKTSSLSESRSFPRTNRRCCR